MNNMKDPIDRIKTGLSIAMLAAVTGCVGVVGGGYGGDVYVPGPDLFLFGGGFDRGHDVHAFSHRGSVSRGVAHGGGGGRGGRR
jgi:hypothetical protein